MKVDEILNMKAFPVRVYLGLTSQKCCRQPIIGCRWVLARAKNSRTGLAGSGQSRE